ncbi:MAG: TldE/PmbA family protein, partial [Candidatus Tectomicrobia bacterium]|nr:TldE/PmbA family protein [Candidatus Tectomicrobia bacterium]
MQDYFYTLADTLTGLCQGNEVYTCTFRGEDSDFIRFNHSAIRQAGTVVQRFLNLDLMRGQQHASADIALSGDLEEDRTRLTQRLTSLREQLPYLPVDPHLLYATEVHGSEQTGENRLPASTDAVAAILQAGQGQDLVGFYASGCMYAGFANTFGQRNWFASHSFNCDWSVYHQ